MEKVYLGESYPARREAAPAELLERSITSGDGRSEWRWIRLANGDLIMGFYPQGDTYFEYEMEVEADYMAAKNNGTHHVYDTFA